MFDPILGKLYIMQQLKATMLAEEVFARKENEKL
jgi:hypothetical protein